ncbi:MAG: hypothetical protein PHV20_07900 [Bacteroidales bacterium]|nr:hypothetical protein [Bacteroidales bacterium]
MRHSNYVYNTRATSIIHLFLLFFPIRQSSIVAQRWLYKGLTAPKQLHQSG